MKVETEVAGAAGLGLKWIAQAGAGVAAGLAGAGGGVANPTLSIAGMGLLAASGVCAAIFSMFYRAHASETPAKDVAITILAPFALAVGAAPYAGAMIFSALGAEDAYRTALAEHVVGGCAIGGLATPAMRYAIVNFDRLAGLLERLRGGKGGA